MKNLFHTILFISLIAFQFISCNNNKPDIAETNLKKDLVINQLSDSSYFSDIISLYFYKGNYYATDYKRDQIIVLDPNLKLVKTIGKKGKGPGELLGASQMVVSNDTIFVYNDYKRTIELFNHNKHLQSINLPENRALDSDISFAINNNKILASSYNEPNSIISYNYKLKTADFFGRSKEYRTAKESRIKNKRHISTYEDLIIAIPDGQPIIELYDSNGGFLHEFDISNLGPVKELLDHNKNKNFPENSYFQIFQDVSVLKKAIFILARTVNNKGEIFTNTIIQFKINHNEIIPVNIFKLGKGSFASVCATDDKILAFNYSTAKLIRYEY